MSSMFRGLLFAAACAAALPVQAQSAASAPRRGADPVLVRTLQDHRWTLQSASDASGKAIDAVKVSGHDFVLRFEGVRLNVQGGCNTMNGSWRVSPQQQLLIGRLAATMKACEPALMQADSALSALLAQPLAPQLAAGSPPGLRLTTPANDTLIFTGTPTPESLYGAAKRIFLEVAPQTVDCTSGAMRTQCLRVREIRYDDKGLKIAPPGEWRIFHGTIEGFAHSAGVRNVLRLKRYTRTQVPADASRYLYVLDLVVESETVKP